MSKINVSELSHLSNGGDPNITLYADGSTSIRNQQNLGQNAIINGSMLINQRGTQTLSTSGYGGPDRWKMDISYVETDQITVSGSTMADRNVPASNQYTARNRKSKTPGANEIIRISQKVERSNCVSFLQGTANAKPFAVQFWAYSSVAGDFVFEAYNAENFQISRLYALPAVTWTKVEFVLPAYTNSAAYVGSGSSMGLEFNWWLAAGSAYTSGSLNTSWGPASDPNRAAGLSNTWAQTVDNYFGLANVQITPTSSQAAYQYQDVSDAMAQCQRYYEKGSSKSYVGGASPGGVALASQFKVSKRVAPTVINYATAGARQYLPNVTEWIDDEGFGSLRSENTNELAFTWTADAEL